MDDNFFDILTKLVGGVVLFEHFHEFLLLLLRPLVLRATNRLVTLVHLSFDTIRQPLLLLELCLRPADSEFVGIQRFPEGQLFLVHLISKS